MRERETGREGGGEGRNKGWGLNTEGEMMKKL